MLFTSLIRVFVTHHLEVSSYKAKNSNTCIHREYTVCASLKDQQLTFVPTPTEAGENSYPLSTKNTPSRKAIKQENTNSWKLRKKEKQKTLNKRNRPRVAAKECEEKYIKASQRYEEGH